MSISEVDILCQIRDWGDHHDDVALDVTWSKPVDELPAPLRTPYLYIKMTTLSGTLAIGDSAIVPASDYDIWRVEQLDDMLDKLEEYKKEIKHE